MLIVLTHARSTTTTTTITTPGRGHSTLNDDRFPAPALAAQGLLINMLKPDEDQSFFNRERDRLAGEIATVRAFVSYLYLSRHHCHVSISPPHVLTMRPLLPQGFEELLSSSNVLNRKLEEVLGMTREYDTIAGLWGRFHELMKGQKDVVSLEEQPLGLPGTGGHVVSSSKQGGSGK